MTRKYRSQIAGAVHKTAEGLHRIGAIDKLTMREFDVMCLTTPGPRESGVSRPKRARFRARESRDPGR
jgi:putative transcriptional regulator